MYPCFAKNTELCERTNVLIICLLRLSGTGHHAGLSGGVWFDSDPVSPDNALEIVFLLLLQLLLLLLLQVFEWLIFKPPPILSSVRRPIGKLTVREQKLEGEYRYVNSRLITNRCDSPAYTSNIYTLELSY